MSFAAQPELVRAGEAAQLLREFNEAGILAPADVHVAARLARLAGERDETVTLAAALAVRAPRLGHVHADLSSIRETVTIDQEGGEELQSLRWPETQAWIAATAASPLSAVGEPAEPGPPEEDHHPLRLLGSRLYLDRYWREERELAAALRAMAAQPAMEVSQDALGDGLVRLFGDSEPRQRMAAATAVLRRLSVIAGGPGTGKTTTVARAAALLYEQATACGSRAPLIALAAPTGRAAARLEQAVHDVAEALEFSGQVRERLRGLEGSTIHRLLGRAAGPPGRFRHDRHRRLPHDVVIVDESSMVSLPLMTRLLDALRPQARLILVGDPAQLASIEAGAVLGDIVGPAAGRLRLGAGARKRLERVMRTSIDAADPPPDAPIAEGIVVLRRVHRFGGAIAELAEAVRSGDEDAALERLADPADELTWLSLDASAPAAREALDVVRRRSVAAARDMVLAARAGEAREALRALEAFRVLCAHRHGPHGVSHWTAQLESWLGEELRDHSQLRWYPGRPLLVTENDPELGLYNGDAGVVVRRAPDRLVASFERGSGVRDYGLARLRAIQTVYAMTIHKSQGSQFDGVAVLLPPAGARILTRELLYTALTRARRSLIVVGEEAAIRDAVRRPIARASGLGDRLWARG